MCIVYTYCLYVWVKTNIYNRVDRHVDRPVDRHEHGRADRHVGGHVDRHVGGHVDGHVDRLLNRRVHRHVCLHVYRHGCFTFRLPSGVSSVSVSVCVPAYRHVYRHACRKCVGGKWASGTARSDSTTGPQRRLYRNTGPPRHRYPSAPAPTLRALLPRCLSVPEEEGCSAAARCRATETANTRCTALRGPGEGAEGEGWCTVPNTVPSTAPDPST